MRCLERHLHCHPEPEIRNVSKGSPTEFLYFLSFLLELRSSQIVEKRPVEQIPHLIADAAQCLVLGPLDDSPQVISPFTESRRGMALEKKC